ncbi:hypothetical protein BJ741DRAFT_443189 [Chytriomyces cf. hyalinus JEL632]|nr:hypothetical protein BJ741DRAFT_443189 [Chytriomyces cf. hyalinus JEL632]
MAAVAVKLEHGTTSDIFMTDAPRYEECDAKARHGQRLLRQVIENDWHQIAIYCDISTITDAETAFKNMVKVPFPYSQFNDNSAQDWKLYQLFRGELYQGEANDADVSLTFRGFQRMLHHRAVFRTLARLRKRPTFATRNPLRWQTVLSKLITDTQTPRERQAELQIAMAKQDCEFRKDSKFCMQYVKGFVCCELEEVVAYMKITRAIAALGFAWYHIKAPSYEKLDVYVCEGGLGWMEAAEKILSDRPFKRRMKHSLDRVDVGEVERFERAYREAQRQKELTNLVLVKAWRRIAAYLTDDEVATIEIVFWSHVKDPFSTLRLPEHELQDKCAYANLVEAWRDQVPDKLTLAELPDYETFLNIMHDSSLSPTLLRLRTRSALRNSTSPRWVNPFIIALTANKPSRQRQKELCTLLEAHGCELRKDSRFCTRYIIGAVVCEVEEVVAVMKLTRALFMRGYQVWKRHRADLEHRLEDCVCTFGGDWIETVDTILREPLFTEVGNCSGDGMCTHEGSCI